MNIAIYTLTSELHDEQAVSAVTKEFLDCLDVTYELKGNDYADYGSHSLNLIYVRTGGTEGIFKRLDDEITKVKKYCIIGTIVINLLFAFLALVLFI